MLLESVRHARARPRVTRSLPVVALGLLGACTFSPAPLASGPDGGGGRDDGGVPGDGPPPDTRPIDAGPPPIPRDVVHVPESAWLASERAEVWDGAVTIDTKLMTITGPGVDDATGLMFSNAPHAPSEPPGPDLAILYLADWTVTAEATVRVTGDRPLVVIATGDIELHGVIDAGAHGIVAGPNGAPSGLGLGAGPSGLHADDFVDSGGGGAGHATAGGSSGRGCEGECDGEDDAASVPGGPGYGEPAVPVLTGGSGGGSGATGGLDACPPGVGGAGGGAIQLYATGTITVGATGGISAGGGGGGGGFAVLCSDSAGGGGGSGGVVYLQARRIELAGVLAANGGGGGSDGGGDAGMDGMAGGDGALSDLPAPGGVPADSVNAGGAGAAGTSPPGAGAETDAHLNGGGGGGAVGRIVLHCDQFAGDGVVSPPPHRIGCGPDL